MSMGKTRSPSRRYVQVNLQLPRTRFTGRWCRRKKAPETKRGKGEKTIFVTGRSVICCRDTLPRRDLAWPCCIGKALRIAADRVNRDTRHCTPEKHVKSPHEIGAKPIPARYRHTQTEGKHAEENT